MVSTVEKTWAQGTRDYVGRKEGQVESDREDPCYKFVTEPDDKHHYEDTRTGNKPQL
jgi:hypothetical protein